MQDRPISKGIWALSIRQVRRYFQSTNASTRAGKKERVRLDQLGRVADLVRTPFAVLTPFAIHTYSPSRRQKPSTTSIKPMTKSSAPTPNSLCSKQLCRDFNPCNEAACILYSLLSVRLRDLGTLLSLGMHILSRHAVHVDGSRCLSLKAAVVESTFTTHPP